MTYFSDNIVLAASMDPCILNSGPWASSYDADDVVICSSNTPTYIEMELLGMFGFMAMSLFTLCKFNHGDNYLIHQMLVDPLPVDHLHYECGG